MQWFDIETNKYSDAPDEDIQKLYAEIRRSARDLTGINLSQDLGAVIRLLEFSNRSGEKNEICAIRSSTLFNLKGKIKSDQLPLSWLGFDIVSLGHWSLLEAGVYQNSPSLINWGNRLNQNGLFDSPVGMSNYVSDYNRAAQIGEVEELPDDVYGIEAIEVARVAKP
jgi:hypothetical protein